jgi:PAS domain S-box-containing protein
MLMDKTLKLLNVEDSERDSKLLHRHLTKAGYELVSARVDDAASMGAALDRESWDIILCDYSLPNFSALKALDLLKERGLDIPLIIISGTIGETAAVEAMRAGAQDYLMKDNLAKLAPTIARELAEAEHRRARREAERNLKASEVRLRAIVETASDAIVIIDEESNLLYFNPSTETVFGYTAGELEGQKLTLLMPEYLRDLHSAGIKAYLETGVKHLNWESMEFPGRHKDGRLIPLGVSFSEFQTNGSRNFTGIIRDISARKEAELELLQSNERYRDLVENAHDIIYSHDLEGNYISINRAVELITGYTREEALRMNINQIVAPEHLEMAREMITHKLEGIEGTAYELDIVAKDGRKVTVEVNTKLVVHDGIPVGVQGIARDITRRKMLEDQLLQSQKLESVGRLAGGIAHDFNNMLTAINGYSDLVLRQLDPDDPMRQNIEEIKKAGERSAELTHQLLAFSRRQILQPEYIDLNETITETSSMLKRLIGEDIELATVLKPQVGSIKVDPGQLSQIIMNLVVNARDAMPDGGKLTIATSNVFLDPDYARSHLGILPGAYVMLSVSDTGIGMTPDQQEQIFEPFYTTKEVGKGTGLGLSTVYGIVKQSGGNILVYSEVGHGTTFKIYLPRVVQPDEAGEFQESSPKLALGTETILLVEDEDLVRSLSRQVLESCGYTVIEAVDGIEALETLEKSETRIDLLITDVVMPRMGGPELAEKLLEKIPNLPILFASGYTDDAIVRHGVLQTNVNFIQKPFTIDDVARKVRDLLDSENQS